MGALKFTLSICLLVFQFALFAQYEPAVELYDLQSDTISVEQHYTVIDANNDGFKDIYFSNYNTTFGLLDLNLIAGDGYSNFTAPDSVTSVFGAGVPKYLISDINGDGNQDVIFTYQFFTAPYDKGIGWYFGNGDGTFNNTPNGIPLPSDIQEVRLSAIEDFDADGSNDLLLVFITENQAQEQESTLSIAYNNGSGVFNSFEIVSELPLFILASEIKLGDIDGDNDMDIVSAVNAGFNIFLLGLINDGNRVFGDTIVYIDTVDIPGLAGFDQVEIDIQDLNSDGTDEVFLSSQSSSGCIIPIHCDPLIERDFSILDFNTNTGEFEVINHINSWPHSYEDYENFRLEYGDINNDGNIDILTVFPASQLKWLLGDGQGNFLTEQLVAFGSEWLGSPSNLRAVDMDLDSDLDIILVNTNFDGYGGGDIWYIENSEFQPDHDEDGIIVDEDCDDTNNQIGDSLIIEGLLPTYEVCEGKAFQFELENELEALTYQWSGPSSYSSNEAEPVIEDVVLADAGIYEVQSSNNNCVSAVVTTELIVGAYPEVTISENGNVLTAVSGDAISYQWYLNENLISGATNQVYTATESGDYTVVVASDLGCETTSTIVTVIISGIYNQYNDIFEMYPNPVKINGTLHLQISNEATFPSVIRVLNSKGQTVLQEEVKSLEHNLNVEGLLSGIYSLQILNKNETATQKFIVVN